MLRRSTSGYSLVELLVVTAMLATGAAWTLPVLTHAADAAEAAAAARYLSGLVARARFEAARRNRSVALCFVVGNSEPIFRLVVDGDGDGVGAADIAAGIDTALEASARLSDHFGGARFAIAGDLPAIDGTGTLTAFDAPIHLGASAQVSFSPLGTASSGTLYIASRRGVQYAVRVAGVTGRVRVLRYERGARQWQGV